MTALVAFIFGIALIYVMRENSRKRLFIGGVDASCSSLRKELRNEHRLRHPQFVQGCVVCVIASGFKA